MTKQRSKTPITIFDVAALAGVSRGTVDRVVYKRGRVSQKTIDKVQKAISQLGYTANPNASSLALKREYTFACLIPEFRPGEYWEKIFDGFRDGVKALSHYNIKLDFHLYDQTDTESYRRCSDEILRTRPMGVITNAVFKEEVVAFAQRLEEAGIPYAFVDNKIDDLDYLLYYGVDPLQKRGARSLFAYDPLRGAGYRADPTDSRPETQGRPECPAPSRLSRLHRGDISPVPHPYAVHPSRTTRPGICDPGAFLPGASRGETSGNDQFAYFPDRRLPEPQSRSGAHRRRIRRSRSQPGQPEQRTYRIPGHQAYSVTIVPGIDGLRGMRHQGDQTAAPQQLRSYGHPASPQSRQLLRPGALRRSSRHRRRKRYNQHFAASSEIVEESTRTYADTPRTNKGPPLAEADLRDRECSRIRS